jgi:hypothetical protein
MLYLIFGLLLTLTIDASTYDYEAALKASPPMYEDEYYEIQAEEAEEAQESYDYAAYADGYAKGYEQCEQIHIDDELSSYKLDVYEF